MQAIQKLGFSEQIRVSEEIFQLAYTDYYLATPNRRCDALDLGANHGYHTTRLALLLYGRGKVVAVEPNPELVGLLAVTARHAGLPNAIIERRAMSDQVGTVTFAIDPRDSQRSFIDAAGLSASAEKGLLPQITDTVTIPWLIERYSIAPKIWKIDTEGYETQVIQGAVESIKTHRPLICFEWHPSNSHDNYFKLYDILAGLGYTIFNGCGDVLDLTGWVYGDGFYFWNYVAFPSEEDPALAARIAARMAALWNQYFPGLIE
jgi:FkbM family methyltransferase